jgi:hypothetical protein
MTKGPGGRPSKFDCINLDQVRVLTEHGFTDKEMASFFGVVISTWHKWKLDSPEFSDSLKEGKKTADNRVVRALYERATGYSHIDTKFATHEGVITDQKEYTKHYAPDTTACIFWLKNRDKENWRDKVDVGVSGKLDLNSLSDVQLELKLLALLAKAVTNDEAVR